MVDLPQKQQPTDRLQYSGNLDPIIARLCREYGIGAPRKYSVVEVGYEDCNIIIDTGKVKYVAKLFAKTRTPANIKRYSTIMETVVDAGINHPTLLRTKKGEITYSYHDITLVLLQFVNGKSFFELDRAPNINELRAVLEEAAKINKIDYKPPYIFDSWAIPNIEPLFDRTKKFIQKEDLSLVKQVISQYKSIPIDKLPHCFVHGDLTKANVMKGKDGRIYILDFSVANWYPKIQELAVITANLMYKKNSSLSLQKRCKKIADEYSKFNVLTTAERLYLPAYALAGVAMEFMGSHQEKFIKGNDTKETEYWLRLGRDGLRGAL